MLRKIINDEHRRKAEEWYPKRMPAYYAFVDYFVSLGYQKDTAEKKALDMVRG